MGERRLPVLLDLYVRRSVFGMQFVCVCARVCVCVCVCDEVSK